MAKDSLKKSENTGGKAPNTVVLSPCVGNSGDNWGGAVAVSATNNDFSLASGAFIAARVSAKER